MNDVRPIKKCCESCRNWSHHTTEEQRDAHGFLTRTLICPVIAEEVRRPEIYWCRDYEVNQCTLIKDGEQNGN